MSDEKKQTKQDIPRYCMECGKEIVAGELFEYIRTKRRTEIYIHRKCLNGGRNHE